MLATLQQAQARAAVKAALLGLALAYSENDNVNPDTVTATLTLDDGDFSEGAYELVTHANPTGTAFAYGGGSL